MAERLADIVTQIENVRQLDAAPGRRIGGRLQMGRQLVGEMARAAVACPQCRPPGIQVRLAN